MRYGKMGTKFHSWMQTINWKFSRTNTTNPELTCLEVIFWEQFATQGKRRFTDRLRSGKRCFTQMD